jgi:hypothetical protein
MTHEEGMARELEEYRRTNIWAIVATILCIVIFIIVATAIFLYVQTNYDGMKAFCKSENGIFTTDSKCLIKGNNTYYTSYSVEPDGHKGFVIVRK